MQKNYRRYVTGVTDLIEKWHYVRGAHIQAFTFSSQDHGRLSAVLWCAVVVWCAVGWCVFLCFFLCDFLFFSLNSLLLFSCSLFLSFFLSSSFLLLSSFLFSLLFLFFFSLFSSCHQTLWKEPINQYGGQLRGI